MANKSKLTFDKNVKVIYNGNFPKEHYSEIENEFICCDNRRFFENLSDDFKILTHSGVFHVDEVFCIALWLLVKNEMDNCYNMKQDAEMLIKQYVKRIPNLQEFMKEQNLTYNDIYDRYLVFDLFDGHYDHHNPKNKIGLDDYVIDFVVEKQEIDKDKLIRNKPVYASFGLFWRDVSKYFEIFNFKDTVEAQMTCQDMRLSVFGRVYSDLIFNMDCIDNYGPNCGFKSEISKMISTFNNLCTEDTNIQCYNNKNGLSDAFINAIMVAYEILRAQIIKSQLDVKAYLEIQKLGIKRCKGLIIDELVKEDYDISDMKNDVHYIEIPKAAEGEEEIKILPANAYEVTTEKGHHCDLVVNFNPSKRDGSITFVVTNSEKRRFSEKFLTKPAQGQIFCHPNLFMITIDTEENARILLEKLVTSKNSDTIYSKDHSIIW